MSNTLSNLIIFATGAAIGSVVTWKLIKTKYEQIAQEEIDSVKEVFSRRAEQEEKTVDEENSQVKEYEDLTEAYTTYSDNEEEKEVKDVEEPYVISPEEFGEKDGYEIRSLNYYTNGIVTDEFDQPIDNDDVDSLIGLDSLNHFGEFEDDSVFVRNDYLETDFVILADAGEYKEEE